MYRRSRLVLFVLYIAAHFNFVSCESKPDTPSGINYEESFASEMVEFEPYAGNPVFSAGAAGQWDSGIRERGYILLEDGIYKMWYTGFNGNNDSMHLGYATSKDGIHWERYSGNPVFSEKWTEDMMVFRNEGKYYMYAEGRNDVAHFLTSDDGIKWDEQGDLIILKTNGDTIPGPYGTPVVWVEGGKWHLFYERRDEGIWLATSSDHRVWKNVNDEPVLRTGPEKFDLGAVAANQIVKYKNRYYLYYHANADLQWASKPSPWSTNVASSDDLIHWEKYPGNPIVSGDLSSGITVFDGKKNRLYTMHPAVHLFFSK